MAGGSGRSNALGWVVLGFLAGVAATLGVLTFMTPGHGRHQDEAPVETAAPPLQPTIEEPAPKPAAVKPAPSAAAVSSAAAAATATDQQVQEDAAAAGMTSRRASSAPPQN